VISGFSAHYALQLHVQSICVSLQQAVLQLCFIMSICKPIIARLLTLLVKVVLAAAHFLSAVRIGDDGSHWWHEKNFRTDAGAMVTDRAGRWTSRLGWSNYCYYHIISYHLDLLWRPPSVAQRRRTMYSKAK